MKGLSFCRKKNGLNCSKIIIKIQLRMVFPFSQILNADVFLELRKTTRHIGKKFIICYKSYFVQTKYIGYIYDEIYRINEGCTNTPCTHLGYAPDLWFDTWYVPWPENHQTMNFAIQKKKTNLVMCSAKMLVRKKAQQRFFHWAWNLRNHSQACPNWYVLLGDQVLYSVRGEVFRELFN